MMTPTTEFNKDHQVPAELTVGTFFEYFAFFFVFTQRNAPEIRLIEMEAIYLLSPR